MSDQPDTIKILKSIQEQVRKAEEAFQKKPGLRRLNDLRFWKKKLAQYSARARARKAGIK